ncbi:hypothetical protein GKC56_04085 [Neisseriaceae bacterium PsAf]|nr:hypothetical protein [Neisseriaceae bacterium PsAf]MCV2504067.1 hypothetical protein [Neisseriaceae bacterium]
MKNFIKKRIKNLQKLGFIQPKTLLLQLDLKKRWQDLSPQEKEIESKRMQIYAAMIAKMDAEIGRTP